jgi:hypothetical protein
MIAAPSASDCHSPGIPFNFNPYLIAGDDALLFHAGPRRMFPRVSEAVAKALPMDRLRYVAFSHIEADECGSSNRFLPAAPKAMPVCSRVAALVSVDDVADRPARPLADGAMHGSAWRGDGAAVLRAPARSLIGRGRTM